jgi:cytochrome c oxidase cbb3-type subunit 3/ubiquinol-cytochrome c reductase cytochrome c subunit
MRALRIFAAVPGLVLPLLAMPVLTGCDMPGRPHPGPEVPRPEAIASFNTLYGENCAGCHGKNGDNGAATNLANPEYQALIDDASMRDVIANGKKGSLMPGFSVRSGGLLTEGQIDVIVRGLRAQWKKENAFGGETPPPYKASHAGDATRGEAVYAAACARCHGDTAQHPGSAGSILDGSFLALINEQTVRTTIIAGRPDIGEPDWRNHIPGRAMTDDEVTDVSAWLIAQRPARPGQPYPSTRPASQPRAEAQPPATNATRPEKPTQP